jgi:hypothetical protein
MLPDPKLSGSGDGECFQLPKPADRTAYIQKMKAEVLENAALARVLGIHGYSRTEFINVYVNGTEIDLEGQTRM